MPCSTWHRHRKDSCFMHFKVNKLYDCWWRNVWIMVGFLFSAAYKCDSHFSTLMYSLSLFNTPISSFDSTIACLCFLSPHILGEWIALHCHWAPAKNSFLWVKCFRMSSLTGTISYNKYRDRPWLQLFFPFICILRGSTAIVWIQPAFRKRVGEKEGEEREGERARGIEKSILN